MSFKLATSPDFSCLINAELPGDNGKSIKASFHLRFKRLSTTEFDELLKSFAVKDGDAVPTNRDQAVIDDLVTGFGDDLLDDNGNLLEFTPDNLAALCDVHPMRQTIVKAFFDNWLKVKAKN